MIGCRLVEIETGDDLARALAEPVAMVVLLGKLAHLGSLRLEEIASVVKPRGIPIMGDAASEHLQRPSPWLPPRPHPLVYTRGQVLPRPRPNGLFLRAKELGHAGLCTRSPPTD